MLTDKDIIKGIKCCKKGDCYRCPAHTFGGGCTDTLKNCAIDLINRLQAENDNWEQQFRILDVECNRLEKQTEKLQAENERLQKAVDIHKGIAEDWKQEARRLKEMVGEDDEANIKSRVARETT